MHIPVELRRFVVRRARSCGEYCLLNDQEAELPHEVDHYIPLIHGGTPDSDNLVFACMKCNRRKGTNLAAFDPVDGSVVALFNPRQQVWHDHFALVGAFLIGLTPSGRATVARRRRNDDARVERRAILIETKSYPPSWLV
jgi:hypothetical protein